jgi:streptogramin lyase
VAAFAVAPASAVAVPTVVQPDIPLPGASEFGPDNEITQGPDGNMWATLSNENAVVQVTPGGTVTKFTPAGLAQPAFGIIAGPDGNLWASQDGGVARIDPATGTTDQFNYGVAGGRGITVGPDGNIWLAATNALVSIPPATPNTVDNNAVTLGNPKGMATGTDGLLWIASGATIVSATATTTPVLTPYAVGSGANVTQDVGAGPDGQVAFANPVDSPQTVGLLVPGGTPQEFPLANTDPFGVTFGQDGAYWFSRFQGNDLLRLTTDGQITTLPWPTALAGPRKIATGPDNTLWTTLDLSDDIGRVTGVDPPPPPEPTPEPTPTPTPTPTAPETTIVKAPKKKLEAKEKTGKAKVKIKFSATGNAPSFECTLTKKGKKPRTGACTSPKKYKLKPGKYKFAVAATADGLTDATPAKAKFKVVEP